MVMEKIIRNIDPEHKFHRISPSSGKIIIWNGENPENIYPTVENFTPPKELLEIAQEWHNKSDEIGDIGCCVIGAKMLFNYNGNEYEMSPQSKWQGEGSWTAHVEWVKDELKKLGATKIHYEYGIMD